jgi:hypothetical protein
LKQTIVKWNATLGRDGGVGRVDEHLRWFYKFQKESINGPHTNLITPYYCTS